VSETPTSVSLPTDILIYIDIIVVLVHRVLHWCFWTDVIYKII
jgi:hypothetical protein